MATAVDTIKTLMNSLTEYSNRDDYIGMIALDKAVRASTYFADTSTAIDKLVDLLKDTEKYPNTDTRLKEATGMVIGAEKDYNADTGAITGSNAGGLTVKNAADIVPETGSLSIASLPTPGSTTPITYTGNDGKSFTFNVKWPDSFSTVVQGFGDDGVEGEDRIIDKRYHVDLNTLDDNYYYSRTNSETGKQETSPTVAQMKAAIPTILKGLNTYWLSEGAKLDYDSLGKGLNGQTIEIAFVAGGEFDFAAAITYSHRNDSQPSNHIIMAVNLFSYGDISSTDPNGVAINSNGEPDGIYLDRVVAHELVHALMFSNGTIKNGMPQFFTEGIAEIVQGDDDYNSGNSDNMITLVNDNKKLKDALKLEPGTGSTYAYPAGHMFLRFLAKQSLDVTPLVGNSTSAQTFSYSTGDAIISGYKEGDVINYNVTDDAELRYADATTTDLLLKEYTKNWESDSLVAVRDVRGKTVNLNTSYGTLYAHMSATAGEVDGRTINGGANYEMIFGANYLDNTIHAGNGGSQLWGGTRGNDELFGGSGVDVFTYKFGDGNDTFQNAESQDQVLIGNITLDQISSAQVSTGGIVAKFTDGSTLNINGTPSTYIIEKNDKYNFYQPDYQTGTWTEK